MQRQCGSPPDRQTIRPADGAQGLGIAPRSRDALGTMPRRSAVCPHSFRIELLELRVGEIVMDLADLRAGPRASLAPPAAPVAVMTAKRRAAGHRHTQRLDPRTEARVVDVGAAATRARDHGGWMLSALCFDDPPYAARPRNINPARARRVRRGGGRRATRGPRRRDERRKDL